MSKRQHQQPLRNNCKQLALMVLGFVFFISLLEAKGMVVWAQRLDVGTVRQYAINITEGMEKGWSSIAKTVTEIRPNALHFLALHGWSDIPLNPDEGVPAENVEQQTAAANAGEGTSLDVDTGKNAGTVEVKEEPTVALPKGWVAFEHPQTNGDLISLPSLKEGQKRHIVLAGDSMMAVGLSAQLQRDLRDYKGSYSVATAYRAATGLARPDVFDWMKKYPAMIGSELPQVVVVAIGANDTQDLELNKKVLKIGSPAWNELYEKRLTEYLSMLTKDGAIVLWIKLPPMRPNKYNANVNTVNSVAQKVVAANPRAIWWDSGKRFLSDKGQFQEFAVIEKGKRQVRTRQSDGIHLTDSGAKLITGDIVGWLNLAIPQAKAVEGVDEVVPKTGENTASSSGDIAGNAQTLPRP